MAPKQIRCIGTKRRVFVLGMERMYSGFQYIFFMEKVNNLMDKAGWAKAKTSTSEMNTKVAGRKPRAPTN